METIRIKIEEVCVYSHYLPALMNRALSGYDSDDLAMINEIVEYADGRIITVDNHESTFGYPDVGGTLPGQVVNINLVTIL